MFFVGFDIGGTKCALSLGKWENEKIEIVQRQVLSTCENPIEVFDAFAPFIHEWKQTYGVTRAGISCGGPLDSEKGIIVCPPNLAKGWHNFEITSYIESRFGLFARLENDANACAVAEWKFGAGRGTKNFIFMTFGTGLGAGLILNGRLYSGTNGNAGEIGHVRLEADGPVGYRKAGSAEGFCSGGGIAQLARIRAKEQGVVLEEGITAKLVFERAKQGDSFYRSVMQESAEKFASVVSILIDLFNPEVIVAGGVFMRNYELFLSIMMPIVEQESLADACRVCRILPAEIGESVGDYAALAIATLEE